MGVLSYCFSFPRRDFAGDTYEGATFWCCCSAKADSPGHSDLPFSRFLEVALYIRRPVSFRMLFVSLGQDQWHHYVILPCCRCYCWPRTKHRKREDTLGDNYDRSTKYTLSKCTSAYFSANSLPAIWVVVPAKEKRLDSSFLLSYRLFIFYKGISWFFESRELDER